eukprot:TRINITY_DN7513_c0_g1_i11.p1 TRINITY_DN7513_c0_g1~~TRINITY_DN7513_c0_g1_i11.p1  ORF type:complete len:545 (-),score=72.08 TRINITY_DN7513_c0_g1_i11:433-2067(-)
MASNRGKDDTSSRQETTCVATQGQWKPDVDVEEISLWTMRTVGFPLCALAGGFVVTCISATNYGFFMGYLGLESRTRMAVDSLISFPKVLLLPLGFLNDCFPIFGYRRKSYMTMGWAICGVSFACILFRQPTEPYYCQDSAGQYIYTAAPCNEDARNEATFYAVFLGLASLGSTMVVCASEGLTIEYCQKEPELKRGTTKAILEVSWNVGRLSALLFVGCCMNGKEYLGTSSWTFSFRQVMHIPTVLSLTMMPICWYAIFESRGTSEKLLATQRLKASWGLMKEKAFFSVLLFAFLDNLFSSIYSTAGSNVQMIWAGVKNLQAQLFSMLGTVMMIIGFLIMQKFLLHMSWRKIVVMCHVLTVTFDIIPKMLTVFDVVRDQYFYLSEDVTAAIPFAVGHMVTAFMVIELAEKGSEGISYGLLGTAGCLSKPMGEAASQQLFGLFQPSLSDPANYVADTGAFRRTVASSFFLQMVFGLVVTVLVGLIPRQKHEARVRKHDWPSKVSYGLITAVLLAFGLSYAVAVMALSLDPSTSCLKMIGGQGCE